MVCLSGSEEQCALQKELFLPGGVCFKTGFAGLMGEICTLEETYVSLGRAQCLPFI